MIQGLFLLVALVYFLRIRIFSSITQLQLSALINLTLIQYFLESLIHISILSIDPVMSFITLSSQDLDLYQRLNLLVMPL